MAPPVLRALSIFAPGALVHAPATLAQAVEPAASTGGIPVQPLARALEVFASQTGLQLVYVSEVVRNLKSHAVRAGLSAPETLGRMLEGTHLTFQYLTPRSIRIVAVTGALPPPAESNGSEVTTLEQIIVTANRREEYAQNVPMTVQVLTETTLARLNATTFEDFVTYLPGITAHGVGPSQNTLYVRGLGTTSGGVQSAGVIGTFPNVSVYLDEQAVQLPQRNLDIYAADLERIEVLEGPQGTLFGAGAEAGVVRYITNKPKLDVTEAKLTLGSAVTAHGAESHGYTATLNVPLIPSRFAVRAVIYDEQRGGYIDNPAATFARVATDPVIVSYFGGAVPDSSVTLKNHDVAGNDINPVSYRGMRVQAQYKFSDEWDLLLSQAEQHFEADGIFTEMATDYTGQAQPALKTQLYNPSYDKDNFTNTAVTINGRLGPLKLLYAGSYLGRKIEQVQDYTQYSRSSYAGYYQCVTPQPFVPVGQCFSPSATWRDLERNTHLSHELRLSTSQEQRISGLGGLFFEDYRIHDQTDWFYTTALPYFRPLGPPTGYYTLNGSPLLPSGIPVQFYSDPNVVFVPSPVTSNNPNLRPPGDSFFDDITRGYTQKAAYASFDVAIIPRTLLLTVGTRYSQTNTSEVGSTVSSDGCWAPPGVGVPETCVDRSKFFNLDAQHLDTTYSGFTSRANLTWRPSVDAMLYYTWSQGFRAGGFNRSPGAPSSQSPLADRGRPNQVQAGLHGGYIAPVSYAPDTLTNDELGWKTTWLNRRLQWNGALYHERWSDTQVHLAGLGVLNISSIINGGDYVVRGLETSVTAQPGNGLTIEAGAAWNHSELVKQATLRWRDGTPIDFSILQQQDGSPIPDLNGQLGTPLAGAPPFQGHLRVRYDIKRNGYGLFAQAAVVHQSHSLTSTFHLARDFQNKSTVYDLPAFTTFDAALGFTKDPWLVQLYGENLGDTRAQLYAYYAASYKAVTTNRPRTIGLRISYTFSDSER